MNEKRPSPKEEVYLDAELSKLGVKAHITHMRQIEEAYYSVITVATSQKVDYLLLDVAVDGSYLHTYATKRTDLGTAMLEEFSLLGMGAALCHHNDNFSRLQGRIIAKRRLLKLTKEENKE